jgi:hypothetical protein
MSNQHPLLRFTAAMLATAAALAGIGSFMIAARIWPFDGGATPRPTVAVSQFPTSPPSSGASGSPGATPTDDPTITVPPSDPVTQAPTPVACAPRSQPGMLVFDCLPDGGMSTQVIAGLSGFTPVSGVTLFFWPEQRQDDCAVNGGLAMLAPGDPGTNLSFPVLTPALQTDPRVCHDLGLQIRFANPTTGLTIEVPRADEEYGATVWDQSVQTQINVFQGSATAGTDGLIAFRFTSSQPFYNVFLSRLPDGEPLFIRSIRYTQ